MVNRDNVADAYLNNRVGPVLRGSGGIAAEVIEAAKLDNLGKELRVVDRVGYIRVDCDGEMIIRRTTLEQTLGRSFKMSELEINLCSFAGRIETTDEYVRFYYDKTL